jgi:hypothetical protein
MVVVEVGAHDGAGEGGAQGRHGSHPAGAWTFELRVGAADGTIGATLCAR